MTYNTYMLLGFLVLFIISTAFLWREAKKYYVHKREMSRTNTMYISSFSVLSDIGVISIAVSAVSFLMVITLWIERGGLEWAVLQFNKLF